MKKSLVWLNLLLITIVALMTQPASAQTCREGNTRSSTYMLREDDKRCEGLGSVQIASPFELVSFSIGRMTTLSDRLKLEVPNRNNQRPKVRVRSFPKNYQLDPLTLNPRGSRYQFQWSNFVLDRENIEPNTLRATAFVSAGKLIYLPVIFSPAAGKYDITLYSNHRSKISELKILQNNQTIYSTSRSNFQPKGQIPFTWNGRTADGKIAPAGLYELRVTAQLEQDDAPPATASINITFAHNPQWLR